VNLVVRDSTGTIAEIKDFKGAVPRRDEWIYVPVGREPFSEPRLVRDVYHEILAPRMRPPRPGDRRYRAARAQTVTVLL
jgi:hypothetical protein